ncbi:hypothetical protein LguiB_016553 [Lonicera macranthoides]
MTIGRVTQVLQPPSDRQASPCTVGSLFGASRTETAISADKWPISHSSMEHISTNSDGEMLRQLHLQQKGDATSPSNFTSSKELGQKSAQASQSVVNITHALDTSLHPHPQDSNVNRSTSDTSHGSDNGPVNISPLRGGISGQKSVDSSLLDSDLVRILQQQQCDAALDTTSLSKPTLSAHSLLPHIDFITRQYKLGDHSDNINSSALVHDCFPANCSSSMPLHFNNPPPLLSKSAQFYPMVHQKAANSQRPFIASSEPQSPISFNDLPPPQNTINATTTHLTHPSSYAPVSSEKNQVENIPSKMYVEPTFDCNAHINATTVPTTYASPHPQTPHLSDSQNSTSSNSVESFVPNLVPKKNHSPTPKSKNSSHTSSSSPYHSPKSNTNKFALLSGRFWGDEEDEPSIQSFEHSANENLGLSDPQLCIQLEEDSENSVLNQETPEYFKSTGYLSSLFIDSSTYASRTLLTSSESEHKGAGLSQ